MNILHGICFAVVGLIATTGMVTAGGGPMVDAGLDQSVPVDTTVQLDATGSTHPEGNIESYEWRIETPDGREIAPDCTACARTTFTPNTTGQYEATVTVTGPEGETASDTLFVDVEGAPADTSPSAGSPETGREITYGSDDGTDPVEIEYTVQNPESECLHDAAGVTATGYARASAIENCDTGDVEWAPTTIERTTAEVIVEVSDYQRGQRSGLLDSLSDFGPRYPQTTGSGGMGWKGELDPVVSEAKEAQQSETGTIEEVLYGSDSAEVITYETDGLDARTTTQKDTWNSQYHSHEGQSIGQESGYNSVEQISGPNNEDIEEADRVEMTVVAGEGEGIVDNLGLSNTYSRENYESDRSSISNLIGTVSSGASDTIERANSVLDSGKNRDSADDHSSGSVSTHSGNSKDGSSDHTEGSSSREPSSSSSGKDSSNDVRENNNAGYVAPMV